MRCEFCNSKEKVKGYKLINNRNIAICQDCLEKIAQKKINLRKYVKFNNLYQVR